MSAQKNEVSLELDPGRVNVTSPDTACAKPLRAIVLPPFADPRSFIHHAALVPNYTQLTTYFSIASTTTMSTLESANEQPDNINDLTDARSEENRDLSVTERSVMAQMQER